MKTIIKKRRNKAINISIISLKVDNNILRYYDIKLNRGICS